MVLASTCLMMIGPHSPPLIYSKRMNSKAIHSSIQEVINNKNDQYALARQTIKRGNLPESIFHVSLDLAPKT